SAGIDRAGEAVAPHSTACLEFAPDSGLWCMASFATDEAAAEWEEKLISAFRLLADSGFGGERSRGWGRAEIAVEHRNRALIDIPEGNGDSAWWLLSLLHPAESDAIDWQRGNYAVVTRGGRIESQSGWGERKRSTRMITEGSVLVASAEPKGTVTDVAPEGFAHPVYRTGYALAVRVP